MTKKFLSEDAIQSYERLNLDELTARLCTGGNKWVQTFSLLLRSYRLASNVANAAWGFMKAEKQAEGPSGNKSCGEVRFLDAMEAALHEYSPGNFPPPAAHSTYAGECFEAFYEQASARDTKEEILELIYEWTCRLQKEAEAQKSPRQPVT